MVVGMIGKNNENKKDFSFIKDEIKKLKDVPKDFDVELYKKLGVSETVLKYWKEIDYRPPYYYVFCLLQANRNMFNYAEYREICSGLVDKVSEENSKIGEAVREFSELEQQGYEWLIKSSKDYIYSASYSFDDGSGGTLVLSCDYDEVMDSIKYKSNGGKRDLTYTVTRFPVIYSENGEFKGIDIDNLNGQLYFDRFGELEEVDQLKDFGFDPMCELALTSPFLYFPHPFKKGDIVTFESHGYKECGIIGYECDEASFREYEERGVKLDGSDFSITVETVDEVEGTFDFGFSHVFPLSIEKYDGEINYKEHDAFSVLGMARQIMMGESGSFSSLMYFMRKQ